MIKSTLDRAYVSAEVLAQPPNLAVGVSDVCDIKCTYCPRQYFKELIVNGIIKLDEFEKLIPLLETTNLAILFGTGEPFLNRYFFDILDVCRHYGIITQTSSHGMSLNEETCRKIIDHKLDILFISIDAPKRKLFEFLREGAIYKEVINNIKYLQKLKKKMGSQTPEIRLAMTISKHNVEYIPAMMKLAKKLDAKFIDYCNLVIVDKNNVSLDVSSTDYFNKMLDKAKKLSEKYGIQMTITKQKPFPWEKGDPSQLSGKKFGCPAAWNMLLIEKDGKARPCCFTEEPYGNVYDDDILSIMNSEKAINFRKQILEGNPPDCCVGCGLLTEISDNYRRSIFNQVQSEIDRSELNDIDKTELKNILEKYKLATD